MPKRKTKIGKSIAYCYKSAWAHDKKVIILLPFYILGKVAASIPLIFIPSIAVTYLNDTKDFPRFAMWLGILLGIYFVLTLFVEVFYTKYNWNNTFVRMRKMYSDISRVTLNCDYEYFDDPEKKRERETAESALWSNWQGAELILKAVPEFLVAAIGLIVYISYSGSINLWMVLILLGMAFFNFLLSYIGNRNFAKHNEITEKYYAKNADYKRIADDVDKGKEIRNYKLGGLFHALFVREYTLFKKYTYIQNKFLILPNLSNSIFGFVRDLVGYVLLTKAVIDGSISLAAFSSMIGILNGCSTYVSNLSENFDRILKGSVKVTYFVDFLKTPSQFKKGDGYPIKDLKTPISIEFDDVSFHYGEDGKDIISHLSFSIKEGERIALVGENGAGKTTIIKLLSLFYKPSSGTIRINGHDILSFDANEYRSLLSSVNQDTMLPGLRLDQIISCQKEPDEEKVMEAIERAGLKDKIESLPKKQYSFYSKQLDSEGILLSGGETQMVMLARALYKDGAILLLDEPTSALDPLMEGKIYDQYAEMCKGKTSIFISHRLSSTRFCDRIFYLEDGKIKEEGTHDELMAKNGSYRKMFGIQARYYKEGGESI